MIKRGGSSSTSFFVFHTKKVYFLFRPQEVKMSYKIGCERRMCTSRIKLVQKTCEIVHILEKL